MSFQAYLDTIKAKTGKTTADFRALAAKKGLTQYRDVMAWLKTDYGLGHGHANAMAQLLVNADIFKAKPDAKIDKIFSGTKVGWRRPYEALLAKVTKFGPDIKLAPTQTYVSLLRGDKKFGIVQPSSTERLDIGIKLKGLKPAERLEAAGSWNIMVTHRVRITDPKQIDKEVLTWLKQAYDAT
jgi:hypothetical protein